MTTGGETEVPEEFWLGVEQFNRGDFYACHDTLEAIWMEAIAPDRAFYQGILQIAVSLYHLDNHNWQGCVILLGEGTRRLRPYQPDYFTVDVSLLVDAALNLLQQLQQSGPEDIEAIARCVLSDYPVSSSSLPSPALNAQVDGAEQGKERRSSIIIRTV